MPFDGVYQPVNIATQHGCNLLLNFVSIWIMWAMFYNNKGNW